MDGFSEDEARRIFAEAARTSAAREATPGGLSLDELQEIGRAAGLDPAAVAAAAAKVRDAEPDIPAWRGVPLATRRTRVIPGVLSDDAWAEAVALLRREFKVQGEAEKIGRQRTWTHAASQMVLVRVTAAETAAGTTLTIESEPTHNRGAAVGFGAILGVTAAFFATVGLVRGDTPALWIGLAVALFGAFLYAAIRQETVRASRREPVRFDALLDRIERLATPAVPSPEAASRETPAETSTGTPGEARIDPGLLDADATVPDSTPDPARRTRA